MTEMFFLGINIGFLHELALKKGSHQKTIQHTLVVGCNDAGLIRQVFETLVL